MSNQPEEGLKKAYSVLETGKPGEAKKILEEIYLFNLDNNEIEFAVWCCSYWIDCVNNLQELSPIEQGETLIYQWKSFEEALRKKKDVYKPIEECYSRIITQKLPKNTDNCLRVVKCQLNKGIKKHLTVRSVLRFAKAFKCEPVDIIK